MMALPELLAAGESVIPPRSVEPLSTTLDDADGLKYRNGAVVRHPETAEDNSAPQSPPTHLLPPKLSRTRLLLIATAATSAVFLSGAGSVALNIALPTIQKDLHMADGDLQWISSAYSLTSEFRITLGYSFANAYHRWLFLASQRKNGRYSRS